MERVPCLPNRIKRKSPFCLCRRGAFIGQNRLFAVRWVKNIEQDSKNKLLFVVSAGPVHTFLTVLACGKKYHRREASKFRKFGSPKGQEN